MTKEIHTCPICEKGNLLPLFRSGDFNYKKKKFALDDLEYSECDYCGSDIVTPIQSKSNQKRIFDEHRKLDGLLCSDDISDIRKRFNLTQSDAAKIFGGGANAFSKYERGEVIQSLSMDRLLRLVDEYPSNLERLAHISGVTPKGARTFTVLCYYDTECELLGTPSTSLRAKVIGREKQAKKKLTSKSWSNSA